MANLQSFVTAARTIRAEHDLPRAQRIEVCFHASDAAKASVLEREKALIESLVGGTLRSVSAAEVEDPHGHFTNAAVFGEAGLRAVVPNVIDPDKERERLQRELKKLDKELTTVSKKLQNPSYVDKAPPEVVEKSRREQAELSEKKTQIEGALARL